ncbi:hypothetical protein SARC_03015 [Sphaeroforma arctica JP610]|uniref:Uncharacterized protein n=1 Tax=Sphaeroforma arctica JP610 TaxID=667725 RepID=A0A0L0G947_9EUKA|nr:hypothetical protein SARC_03015 [Sphaeroforma arctica JP610]KNC84773.1 hypothetical protein SARC_03015 [Sphaeroforma arctica JP610]|eukprot:XP_014158675.1 hypothetical protein SARC_03015 [Sphaeroforma arctica JP610]
MKGAIVTGGSSGIGAAVCVELAKRNFRVFILGRNESAMRDLVTKCETSGGKAGYGVGDVGDETDTTRLYTEAKTFLEATPDVLVLSAGIGRFGNIGEVPMKDFDDTYRANVRGVFLWLNKVVPDMRERNSGRIVAVSSIVGMPGMAKPTASVYSSTKAAVQAIFSSLRMELKGTQIKAGTISPGMAKMLTPEDVAEGVMSFVEQSETMNTDNVVLLPQNM